jgi:glycosyltransferase involved in cell wall biosynthesis
MKVAVLLAAPWIPGSVDMTEYLRMLRRMGHESLMICLDRSEGPAGFEVHAENRATLEDPAFYSRLKLDAVIAFTWFNNPLIVLAIKKAGAKVLIRGDSDGLLSIRDFPLHHTRVRLSGAQGLIERLTGCKHLLQRYLFDHAREDQYRLNSIADADVSVVETAAAAKNVAAFLEKHNRPDLIERLKVVPHFVADGFLNQPVPVTRSNSVVAIGRWEDPQKNAALLCGTIQLHLTKYTDTQFRIIGPEKGRTEFEPLTSRFRQVTFVGPQNATGVREHLANARILLSSSRWEGSPVVGNEALAMGVTVVGTPIPAFVDIANHGGYATVATSHSPTALATALEKEMAAWQTGQRDPLKISEYWRPKLSSELVIGELVRLVLGHRRVFRPELELLQVR